MTLAAEMAGSMHCYRWLRLIAHDPSTFPPAAIASRRRGWLVYAFTADTGRLPCELDLARVRQYAEAGMSFTTAAPLLGCSRRTLLNRMKDTPAVRAAWDRGLAQAVARVAEKLAARIDAGDLRAITFFLARKGGFAAPRREAAAETPPQDW